MRRGVQARGPGAHLGGSIDKSIESDKEMNEFRDELQNEAWELEIQSGSSEWSLARPLSIKATFWSFKLISVIFFKGKCDFCGRVQHEFKLQNYENTIFTVLLEARALVVWAHGDPRLPNRKKQFLQNNCKYSTFRTFGQPSWENHPPLSTLKY